MDFKMEHVFDHPVGKIVPILAAGQDLIPMEELPNVSQRKVIERRREGAKMYSRLEWCVHGQIPVIAQKIISPDKLTFEEQTIWDDNTQTFVTRIVPHFLKDKFDCRTASAWSACGDAKSRRTFSGTLIIKVPIIGPIMEKTIIDYLKKNNDKNAVLVTKALAQRFSEKK
jgi:hypothetical protein